MANGANQPAATEQPPQIPDYGLMLLTVDNLMKIGAAEVRPEEPGIIPIIGKNGAGKTSLLTALSAALLGKDQLPKMPVKKGAKKGRCVVKLGEAGVPKLTIQYTMTDGSKDWSLTLLDDKGREIQRPREVLDMLMQSKLLCDPIALTTMDKAKQQEMLFQSVPGLSQELDKLNAAEAKRADAAKDVRAEKKAVEGSMAKLGAAPPRDLATKEPVSSTDIMARINKSRDIQRQAENAEAAHSNSLSLVSQADSEIARLQSLLEEALAYRTQLDAQIERQAKDMKEARELASQAENIADLEAEMNNIDMTNQSIANAKTYYELEGELTKLTRQLDKYDEERDDIADKKKALLAKIPLPVDGLTYDEEQGLLYTGVPIAQASMAQKIRIGMAMGIAMQPHIKLFVIRELGSLLDADNLQLLDELCKANGFHALIECVQGDRGIVIEDGYSPGLKPEDGAEGGETPEDE